jgi:ABC-type transport system substrate-binding protein
MMRPPGRIRGIDDSRHVRRVHGIRVVTGLAVLGLLAVSCTGNNLDATTSTLAVPTSTTAAEVTTTSVPETTTTIDVNADKPYGGEVVAASTQEPSSLNSFLPGGASLIGQTIAQSLSSGVYDIDPTTMELVPDLVTELPTVDNGGVTLNDDGSMTVTYIIRDEAIWADGTQVSGDDFAFTLEMILDPDIPTDKRTYEDIVTTTVGPKEFSYTLDTPTIGYERLFGEILPEHDVEGSNFMQDWNDTRWVSSGPFTLADWTQHESLTVVRNDNYWKTDELTDQQLPFLDGVTWRFLPDPEDAIEAFLARDVDIVNPPSDPGIVEVLRAEEPRGATVEVVDGPVWENLSFQFGPGRIDVNPDSCGEQLDMRRAVAMAIDKDALAAGAIGYSVPGMDSYVDAYAPALSTEAWSRYEFDPGGAQQHYLAAVEATGRECSIVISTPSGNDRRAATSMLLAGMFDAAGIPTENRMVDGQAFFTTTLDEGAWDLAEWGWVGGAGMEALIEFQDFFDPTGQPPEGSNLVRWGTRDSVVRDESTERFAEIQEELRTSVDRDRLAGLIAESEEILADQVVMIPLFANPEVAAVWADELSGFVFSTSAARYTWNIEDWHRTIG